MSAGSRQDGIAFGSMNAPKIGGGAARNNREPQMVLFSPDAGVPVLFSCLSKHSRLEGATRLLVRCWRTLRIDSFRVFVERETALEHVRSLQCGVIGPLDKKRFCHLRREEGRFTPYAPLVLTDLCPSKD